MLTEFKYFILGIAMIKLRLLPLLLLTPYLTILNNQIFAMENEVSSFTRMTYKTRLSSLDKESAFGTSCSGKEDIKEIDESPNSGTTYLSKNNLFLPPPLSYLTGASPSTPYSALPSLMTSNPITKNQFHSIENLSGEDSPSPSPQTIGQILLSLQKERPPLEESTPKGIEKKKRSQRKDTHVNKISIIAEQYVQVMHLPQPAAIEELHKLLGRTISISTLKRRFYESEVQEEIKNCLLKKIPEPLLNKINEKNFKEKLLRPGNLRWPKT